MIDTWLFTALVLGVLALCVILRSVPVKSRNDRLVAGTVAIVLAAMTAPALGIAFSSLVILDAGIVIALAGLAFLIWTGKQEADAA